MIRLESTYYYHRGHAWVKVENGLVRVGIDDFASKLLGKVEKVELPEIGQRLEQGAPAIKIFLSSSVFEILSPIKGEVVDKNENVVERPSLLYDDPYEKGWLLIVRPHSIKGSLANLFSGKLAEIWFEDVLFSLDEKTKRKLDKLFRDGSNPTKGLAKIIDSKNWERIIREFLLIED